MKIAQEIRRCGTFIFRIYGKSQ